MAKKSKKKKQEDPATAAKEKESLVSMHYPLWAKLAVAYIVIVWCGIIALVGTGINIGVHIIHNARDPAYIEANINKLARFDKLPDGFTPTFAIVNPEFNMNLAALTYKPDGTGFMLGILPQSEIRDRNAKQIAESLADSGIPNVSNELSVEKKGSAQIAGETLEYVIGTASDRPDNKIACFIGCAILKDKRVFLVYGLTPAKEGGQNNGQSQPEKAPDQVTFNMDAADRLFSAIKGF